MRKKVLRYFGWVCAELILLGVIIACIFEIPRNIEAKKVVDKGVIVKRKLRGLVDMTPCTICIILITVKTALFTKGLPSARIDTMKRMH